jgi:hypothetical protein
VIPLVSEAKLEFKKLVFSNGISEQTAAALWVWYDSNSKGVATFRIFSQLIQDWLCPSVFRLYKP